MCCSKVPNLWCFGMSYLGNQRQTSSRCFCVQTDYFTIEACLFRRELYADVKFSKKSCSEGISLGEYLTNLAAVLTRWNQTDRETLSRTGTAWVLHLRTLFNMTKESCILAFWYLVDNLLRGVLEELSGRITADTYAWTKENVALIVCYSYK